MDGSSTTAVPVLGGSPEATADSELANTLGDFASLDYRDRFWPRRRYEDQADRIALRALLPATGNRLVDVGAGFGRLADEFGGYCEVILVDPSETMLRSARERLGDDPRVTILPGTVQHLPLPDGSVDAVVCVRVLHHVSDLRPAIAEFARVLHPGGVLVMEMSNKRNLKAILAYLIRRRQTSPLGRGSQPYVDFTLLPHRPTNTTGRGADRRPGDADVGRWSSSTWYLHAPNDVRTWLNDGGFDIRRTRSVGLLRAAFVTRHVPTRLLVALERIIQPGLARVSPGPSLFVAAVRRANGGLTVRRRRDGGRH